jgi:hypothetical protein
MAVRLGRSPTVRAFFEPTRRDELQRKKIALVATAHYRVRVMRAMLKRGTVWEGGLLIRETSAHSSYQTNRTRCRFSSR